MIKCALAAGRITSRADPAQVAALAAAPVQPLLGSGAAIGPIRAIAVIVCAGAGMPASPADLPAAPTIKQDLMVRERLLMPPSLPLPGRSVSPPATRVAPSAPVAASGQIIPVPEPASIAILALGVAGIAAIRRRGRCA